MEFRAAAEPLTSNGFDDGAERLGVEAAKLWAVFDIESKRCGFLPDRRPVILFERHKFHGRTQGKYSQAHPSISNPEAGGYGKGGAAQYLRLREAIALDRAAALWSTSWGLGQIMGFNHATAGYASPEALVTASCESEDAQLQAMVRFLVETGLSKPLRTGNWTSFARGYNGEKYYINKYDDRLRAAHNKYSTGPTPDLVVRNLQLLLTYLDYSPGIVDGWFGPATLNALNAYRADHGLPESSGFEEAQLDDLRRSIRAL